MVSKTIVVPGHDGFHMRSASILASRLDAFGSDVLVIHKGHVLDAKSVLSLVAACLRFGDEVEIVADGIDEVDALRAACDIIEMSRVCCFA